MAVHSFERRDEAPEVEPKTEEEKSESNVSFGMPNQEVNRVDKPVGIKPLNRKAP